MGFDSPTSGVYLCVKVRSFSWFVERLDYFGDMNWVLDMSMKTVLDVRLQVKGV